MMLFGWIRYKVNDRWRLSPQVNLLRPKEHCEWGRLDWKGLFFLCTKGHTVEEKYVGYALAAVLQAWMEVIGAATLWARSIQRYGSELAHYHVW